MATILNWMKSDMHKKAMRSLERGGRDDTTEFEFNIYSDKMIDYSVVFDEVVNDFINETFGEYANKVSSEEFLESLQFCGWKYFDL